LPVRARHDHIEAFMKTILRESIRGDRIDEALPPAFRHHLPTTFARADALYSLLLFANTEETVVRSPAVLKALARTGEGARVVAVAGNFTEEARLELSARGAVVVTLRDSHWTDEAHSTLRERFSAALRRK
jgi:hypothetical protein